MPGLPVGVRRIAQSRQRPARIGRPDQGTQPVVAYRHARRPAGLVSPRVRELRELLPRYEHDNLFDSTKFKRRFPEFAVTSYREGLELIRRDSMGR